MSSQRSARALADVNGGIILAVGSSRGEIERIAREDPFCARGLADFRLIEFRASQKAGNIQARIEEAGQAGGRRV